MIFNSTKTVFDSIKSCVNSIELHHWLNNFTNIVSESSFNGKDCLAVSIIGFPKLQLIYVESDNYFAITEQYFGNSYKSYRINIPIEWVSSYFKISSTK